MTHCGLAVGFTYDVLRVLRWALKSPPRLTAALDVLFGVLALATVLFFFVLTGEKGLRVYVVLGLLCGVTLYGTGIAPLTARLYAFFLQKKTKNAKKHEKP